MYSFSEVLAVALALGLAPIFIWSFKRLELRDKGFLGLAFVVSFISLVATIVEGYWLPDVFNTVEHGFKMIAAISFALFGARFFRRSVRQGGGGK